MKFTVSRKKLEEELGYVSTVLVRGIGVSSKLTLTVAPTGELELRGNSHKGELVSFIDCESSEPGQLEVPPNTLTQLVRLHPDEHFSAEAVKGRLRVKWSTGVAILAGLSAGPVTPSPIERCGTLF